MIKLATLLWFLADFSGSCGGTLESGRCVTATSDAWSVSCDYDRDTATIDTDGLRVVVSPTEVNIDGHTLIPIAETTSTVDVRLRRGTITLIADGKTVAVCTR